MQLLCNPRTSAAHTVCPADLEAAASADDLPEVIRSATEGPAVLYRKGREDGIYRGVSCREALPNRRPQSPACPSLALSGLRCSICCAVVRFITESYEAVPS